MVTLVTLIREDFIDGAIGPSGWDGLGLSVSGLVGSVGVVVGGPQESGPMSSKYTTVIPPAFLTEIGGGVGSKSWQKKEKHVDIVDTSDARLRGLWVFG